jgi:hypothetical protein
MLDEDGMRESCAIAMQTVPHLSMLFRTSTLLEPGVFSLDAFQFGGLHSIFGLALAASFDGGAPSLRMTLRASHPQNWARAS